MSTATITAFATRCKLRVAQSVGAPRSGLSGFYDFTLTNGCQIRNSHIGSLAQQPVAVECEQKVHVQVVPLNPYLASIPSFYANSVPFVVKSNFHTDVPTAFILDDTGAVVADVKTNRVVSAGASRT